MAFHCGIQEYKNKFSFPAPLWPSFQHSKQLLVAGEMCPREAEIAVAELGPHLLLGEMWGEKFGRSDGCCLIPLLPSCSCPEFQNILSWSHQHQPDPGPGPAQPPQNPSQQGVFVQHLCPASAGEILIYTQALLCFHHSEMLRAIEHHEVFLGRS